MRALARSAKACGRDKPRWAPDLDALRTLVTERTRAILICNPNNPTGARLTAPSSTSICAVAAALGAWVVSDEIYRGAELDGVETPTVWGRYERVIVTSGLSKAFALPGLRIGWVVAPPALIDELWGIHDYTTIAPGAINDRLARIALAPQRRELLLARTRGILRTNYPTLKRWIERRAATLTHVPPEAGAIAFVRYSHRIGSTALVERIRDEQSVLRRARRSLRDGRLPAHRLRLRPGAARAGARTDRRSARLGGRRHRASSACALISRSSASATSAGASRACIAEQAHTLRTTYDLEPRIVGIATRRHGSAFARTASTWTGRWPTSPPGISSKAPAAVRRRLSCFSVWARAARPLRVLVETTTLAIADGQPAIRHIEAAIDAGCHAVTANKGPVAFAYRRLRDRAAAAGVSFLFEGAVMDGVPVFNLVRETMPAVTVRGFRGVVNSTTNHILTALENGDAFAPALARMQAEGIAEADASLDVDGWDAAAKTAALANVLMDADLTPHLVDRTGIGPESAAQAQEALPARLHASASSHQPAGTIAARSSRRFVRWSCRPRIS